jgi:hypothetical protein
MIELEEPFLRLAAGSGKGITADIVFSVRITLENNKPEELSVSYEFAEGFDVEDFFNRIPVSSLGIARVGLHRYFVDVFKLLGVKVENSVIIESNKIQFLLSTDNFKVEPRFLSSDILKTNKKRLLR